MRREHPEVPSTRPAAAPALPGGGRRRRLYGKRRHVRLRAHEGAHERPAGQRAVARGGGLYGGRVGQLQYQHLPQHRANHQQRVKGCGVRMG